MEPVSSQDWDGVIVTAADFQALQAFKLQLNDPKGFLRSWNDSGYGACSGGWAGIKCAQGQVIVIQLPWKGLGGQISDKIGQLQALRKLSLHDNDIQGPIPYSLGLIPDLRGLQLFNNRLSGSIPSSLGFSPVLQTLDLGNNSLTGTIPNGLANSSKLLRVNVSHNSLSGSIPITLIASKSLLFLSLEHNRLSGQIPDSWGFEGGGMGLGLGLVVGKDLRRAKRDSRSEARMESSEKEEQLMAEICSRTQRSFAWERSSFTAAADSEFESESVSERKDIILFGVAIQIEREREWLWILYIRTIFGDYSGYGSCIFAGSSNSTRFGGFSPPSGVTPDLSLGSWSSDLRVSKLQLLIPPVLLGLVFF